MGNENMRRVADALLTPAEAGGLSRREEDLIREALLGEARYRAIVDTYASLGARGREVGEQAMNTLIVGALAVLGTASITLPLGWGLGHRRRKATELRWHRHSRHSPGP